MTMYEKFSKLLQENKVTPYRIHKETGISTATLSDWKNGKSEPKRDKIQKICDFFNVSISYFYEDDHEDGNNAAQEEGPTLTPKDERDIARKLEETLNQLDSHDGLFQGRLVIGVNDIQELNNLLKKITNIKGVKHVQRIN